MWATVVMEIIPCVIFHHTDFLHCLFFVTNGSVMKIKCHKFYDVEVFGIVNFRC